MSNTKSEVKKSYTPDVFERIQKRHHDLFPNGAMTNTTNMTNRQTLTFDFPEDFPDTSITDTAKSILIQIEENPDCGTEHMDGTVSFKTPHGNVILEYQGLGARMS